MFASLFTQVFRLLSLWFNLSTNPRVVDAMLETVKKVHSQVFVNVICYVTDELLRLCFIMALILLQNL
jgi:hypothetical protein